jgi:hypothetical protein
VWATTDPVSNFKHRGSVRDASKSDTSQSFVETRNKFKAVGMISSSRMELEIVPATCDSTRAQIRVVKPLTNEVSAVRNRICLGAWVAVKQWVESQEKEQNEREGLESGQVCHKCEQKQREQCMQWCNDDEKVQALTCILFGHEAPKTGVFGGSHGLPLVGQEGVMDCGRSHEVFDASLHGQRQ